MYTNDDIGSAKPIDRIIAALSAGLCGYFVTISWQFNLQ
jgi:hypothetical protein